MDPAPRVVSAAEAAAREDLGPGDLGGKGWNLARLVRLGLPVPPWVALTTAVLRQVQEEAAAGLRAALAGLDPRERGAAEAASARVRELLLARGLAPADREDLRARLAAAFPPGARLAVRSSAQGEDSARDSFAGQLDTFLHVTPEEVEARALECLASAWSPRALLYRHTRGLEPAGVEVAVLVQLMVESRAAGVLFTADPATGRRDVAVVSAGLGLGEGVVSDRVSADTWWLDLESGEVLRAELAEKAERVVFDRARGSGTALEPVSPAEAGAPALEPPSLRELVGLGRRLAAALGAPQDLEWAQDAGGALHLLQARPITALPPAPPEERQERVFDNQNVVEGYPGATTPLTFSFARTVYEATFRDAAGKFGIPAAALRQRDLWPHLIARVDGRVYYDLLNWYRVYALVPGFEQRVRAWEKALGLPPRAGATRRRGGGWALRARVLLRIVGLWRSLDREVAAFQARFQRVQAALAARDLDALPADELLACYEQLQGEVLDHAAVTLVNDFFAFQLHEAVGKLLARWRVGGEGLLDELLGGEGGVESVEPARSLLRLAARARATPAVAALLAQEPDDRAAWARLQAEPAARGLLLALDEHVRRFGDRTVRELQLETPGLADDPALAVGLLRGALQGDDARVEALEAREAGARVAAEARVRSALRGRPLRRWVFARLLARARSSVKQRENLRLLRARAYGLVKRLFRRLGARLHAAGLLGGPEDVFFLGVEEVVGAVRGTSLTRDLRALVALRRREHEEHLRREPAERIALRGIAMARPFPQAEPEVPLAPGAAGEVLRGTGCAPGSVRARARVVLDPCGAPPPGGEVLVARSTDPGWVFLMVQAAGLVVERGSPLSHTAIVGRELGIPTVVGVAGATRRIATGALLELDGAAGTVRIVEQAPG